MIAETTRAAVDAGARRAGVLATPGGEALYAAALKAEGLEPLLLEGADRQAFMACVYGVKRGDTGVDNRTRMAALAHSLVKAGANVVIAGCTEVPLLLEARQVQVPFIDSAEVLAEICVRTCVA